MIPVPVRLKNVNGGLATEGYVEVFDKNTKEWGYICDNSYDILDAHVICRMLNYTTAIEALAKGTAADLYGIAPSGSIFTLNDLDCSGSELSIFDCLLTPELTENCDASEIAGVKCTTSKLCLKKL